MTACLLALLLAAPCPAPTTATEGQPAPCDGVLLPHATGQALLLAAEELESCRHDRETDRKVCRDVVRATEERAERAEVLAVEPVIVTQREGLPWWGTLLVGVGAVGIGVVVGVSL